MVPPLWATTWQFLRKLNKELPCDPGTLLLDIYPKELKTETQTPEYTTVYTDVHCSTLSRIAKKWKQFRRPSTDGWTNKMK